MVKRLRCAALGASEQRKRIYMPRALAKFRQGFGRLIRSQSDQGWFYLLDPRVVSAPYGRAFLASLPECRVVLDAGDEDPEAIAGTIQARIAADFGH